MPRLIYKFESTCVFCGEKSKTETVQGVVACTTCGAEDPDNVPFYAECDFLQNRSAAENAYSNGRREKLMRFSKNEERSVAPVEKPKELTEEEKLKLKILNSRFLSDKDKRGKLHNIHKLTKSLVESKYEQREAEKREDRIKTIKTFDEKIAKEPSGRAKSSRRKSASSRRRNLGRRRRGGGRKRPKNQK